MGSVEVVIQYHVAIEEWCFNFSICFSFNLVFSDGLFKGSEILVVKIGIGGVFFCCGTMIDKVRMIW